MAELIQKITPSLVKKFKEVASPDEKIHFCIEGVKGNALIGTSKKLYFIISGSFKGTLSYSYPYNNIVDIKLMPPLHGEHITLTIIPQQEDKELKARLYFEPEQNDLLKQILTKISSLSTTYTYIEPMKEISIHQTSNEFIVPMKNILGSIYDKNIKASEKVIICLSLGDHQGLVCTNERILIFKIIDEKTPKIGIFPLEEITDVEYSIGLVTGHLQIITPKLKVIKKMLREQELLNIANIISFSKKNYGELMDEVSKRLQEIINNAKKKKSFSKDISDKEEKKRSPEKKKDEKQDLEEISIDDISVLEAEPEEVKSPPPSDPLPKEVKPSLDEIAQKLSQEILEEIKSDEQSFAYSREIVNQISFEVLKHSFPELSSNKLADTITDYVMKNLAQKKIPPVSKDDMLDEYADFDMDIDIDDADFDVFPVDMVDITPKQKLSPKPDVNKEIKKEKSSLPAGNSKTNLNKDIKSREKPLSSISGSDLNKEIKKERSSLLSSTPKPEVNKEIKKERSSLLSPTPKPEVNKEIKKERSSLLVSNPRTDLNKDTKSKEKSTLQNASAVQKKLADFTSLKNISAALLMDSTRGNIIYKAILEEGSFDKSSKTACDYIKYVKSSRLASKGSFIPQWKTEYEQGMIYVEEVCLNYLLILIGTEKSNFASLKLFIEKNKEELKKELK